MNEIRFGDCRDILRQMALDGVKARACVTSPPYWSLRDYGVDGQFGMERIPDCLGWATGDRCGECHVCKIVDVFRLVRGVLADDGTCWVNYGDSYAGSLGAQGRGKNAQMQDRAVSSARQIAAAQRKQTKTGKIPDGSRLKPKDMVGMPWRIALALQADGWYLRQDIIWHKPNPMPESVRDRCTKAHEYLFLLSKSPRYFFDRDAIAEPAIWGRTPSGVGFGRGFDENEKPRAVAIPSGWDTGQGGHNGLSGRYERESQPKGSFNEKTGEKAFRKTGETRNKRTVWNIATKPFNGKKMITDYVGTDGKPYIASSDCPIHGHLSRQKKADKPECDGQLNHFLCRSADIDGHPSTLPVYVEKSKTCHNELVGGENNLLMHNAQNKVSNKKLLPQTECVSADETHLSSCCTSEFDAHPYCKMGFYRQHNSLIATFHSKKMSKTARVRETMLTYKPFFEIGRSIQRTQDQRELSAREPSISENNTLIGGSPFHPLPDKRPDSAGKLSEPVVSAFEYSGKCSCKEAIIDHFATFPPALVEPCILAGSAPGDIILDPFIGSGTVAEVAILHGRQYLGCELNPEYKILQDQRIASAITARTKREKKELAERLAAESQLALF